MNKLKLLMVILPVFLFFDLVWLGLVMSDFYRSELGELARRDGVALSPRWVPAIVVYLLIPSGLILFVRPLLTENSTVWQSFGWGAAFGLVLYGVYDLTNLAVIEKWTTRMTFADIIWGCVLCGSMSVIMKYVDGWISKS